MSRPNAELNFVLEVEDDWPPVALECLPVEQVGPFVYQLSNPPLFIKGLSVGEVLEVSVDEKNHVVSWKILEASAHSTIWISRLERVNRLESILEALRILGCGSVAAPTLGCYSVDVPETVAMADIDTILGTIDVETLGIAFPSFRHPD
jgi:hypothetical protein